MSKELILSATLSIVLMAGFALSSSQFSLDVAAPVSGNIDLSVPGPSAFFRG